MDNRNKSVIPREMPPVIKSPEITYPIDPEELIVPDETPEIVPDEDPYENPPPYEMPEPGEGP